MKKIMVIFYFVFFSGSLWAAEIELTLELLIQSLTQNHPQFREAQESLNASSAEYKISAAKLKPQINIIIPSSLNFSPFIINSQYDMSATPEVVISQLLPGSGTLSLAVKDQISVSTLGSAAVSPLYHNPDIGISLTQPLYFKPSYNTKNTVRENIIHSATLHNKEVTNGLIMQCLKDYYSLKQLQFQWTLSKSRLARSTESYMQIEKKYNLGILTRSVYSGARIALLKAQNDFSRMKRELNIKKELMQDTYHIPGIIVVTPDIEVFKEINNELIHMDIQDSIDEAFRNNTSLARKRINLSSMEFQEMIIEREHAPVLDFNAHYSINTTLSSTFSINLSLSAGLFDRGSFNEKIKQKASEKAGIRNSAEWEKISLASTIKLLFSSIENNESLSNLFQIQEEEAHNRIKNAELKLTSGQLTEAALFELYSNLETIQINSMENRIKRNITLLRIYDLMGRNLLEYIQGRNSQQDLKSFSYYSKNW